MYALSSSGLMLLLLQKRHSACTHTMSAAMAAAAAAAAAAAVHNCADTCLSLKVRPPQHLHDFGQITVARSVAASGSVHSWSQSWNVCRQCQMQASYRTSAHRHFMLQC